MGNSPTPATVPAQPTTDLSEWTPVVSDKPSTYIIAADAPRAVVSDGVYVTRGKNRKSGAPAIVKVAGPVQTGFLLSDLARVFEGGVIGKAEVDALFARASK